VRKLWHNADSDTSAHVGRVALRVFRSTAVMVTNCDYIGCKTAMAVTTVLRLISSQREIHGDLGFDFDRLAIQHVRTVSPLLDRLNRCLRQHGMAAQNL